MPRSHNSTMDNLRLQRRHYQFIAEVIKDWAGKGDIALAFADALRGTNANYSKIRFIAACGDVLPPTPLCLLCQAESR
jgi:hypothetical protein